jgi:transposase
MRYSEGFRRSIVRKVQESDGKSLDDIAREHGIHPATLGRWIQQLRASKLADDGADGIQPSHRNPGEKLELLLESRTVKPDAMGEWLRRNGMHSEHLRLWEQELGSMATDNENKINSENSQLRKENKALKKELARKEKALAEAAVLLTLKKKYPTIFEHNEED